MKTDGSLMASLEAERVLNELGITSLPIDPFEIASHHKIDVAAKPVSSPGVSGMLVRVGNCFGIVYATHIQNEGFQRFSISHELGHYFLSGHVDAVLGDRQIHESRAGFATKDKYEEEADYFAASLLMPRRLFSDAVRKAGNGLAAIEHLRDQCNTSLLATAIRFTQCTRDPVAVIVSSNGVIDYCFMSEALKVLDGIDWIKKRQAVPKGTPTFSFNQNQENIERGARVEESADIQDWFGGRRSIEVGEDVVGLGQYGKTLTVLYDIEIPDPEDDEEEESLKDSWTPRFR